MANCLSCNTKMKRHTDYCGYCGKKQGEPSSFKEKIYTVIIMSAMLLSGGGIVYSVVQMVIITEEIINDDSEHDIVDEGIVDKMWKEGNIYKVSIDGKEYDVMEDSYYKIEIGNHVELTRCGVLYIIDE